MKFALTRSTYILMLAGIIALAGCSSQKKQPPLTETFSSQIRQDQSRVFTYTVSPEPQSTRRNAAKRSRAQDANAKRNNQRPQSETKAELAAHARDMLDAKLEDNQLCPDGYIELASFFSRGRYTIRGECRDNPSLSEQRSTSESVG